MLRTQLGGVSVRIMEGIWIEEVIGDGRRVTGFRDITGKFIEVDGIFIELGAKGAIELAVSLGVELDKERGEII